jgi:DNA-binding transcriptional ArsR family regulator
MCDRVVTMMGVQDHALDRVLRALADPTRRRLWLELARAPGATTGELAAAEARLTRWAVMKHLAVLRDAALVETLPDGRRRRHYPDARPLGAVRAWLEAAGR